MLLLAGLELSRKTWQAENCLEMALVEKAKTRACVGHVWDCPWGIKVRDGLKGGLVLCPASVSHEILLLGAGASIKLSHVLFYLGEVK